jgi:hypothetical protein
VGSVFLVRRQSVHVVAEQDAMHGGHGHSELMKPLQVVSDSAGAKVIILAQIENLANDIGRDRCRRPMRAR